MLHPADCAVGVRPSARRIRSAPGKTAASRTHRPSRAWTYRKRTGCHVRPQAHRSWHRRQASRYALRDQNGDVNRVEKKKSAHRHPTPAPLRDPLWRLKLRLSLRGEILHVLQQCYFLRVDVSGHGWAVPARAACQKQNFQKGLPEPNTLQKHVATPGVTG